MRHAVVVSVVAHRRGVGLAYACIYWTILHWATLHRTVLLHGAIHIVVGVVHLAMHVGVMYRSAHISVDGVSVHVDATTMQTWSRRVGVHTSTVYCHWKTVEHTASHGVIHGWSHSCHGAPDPGSPTLVTVIVNDRPKALFQPAYLPEDFLAAHHLLLSVLCGCDVR